PPPRCRRLTGDGVVLTALLGEDRVGGGGRPDRLDHQLLRHVVRLGHDVTRALVVDALQSLVPIHQDLARASRERDGELELLGRPPLLARRPSRASRGHGVRHSTWRSALDVPNSVTSELKVRRSCAARRGVVTKAAVPVPPSSTLESRHVVPPVASPSFVTVNVTVSPVSVGVTPSTFAGNGPLPAIDSRASTARMMIAAVTAMNTDPWTCPEATSRSPSGLHSSQSPMPGPTGFPQRAHGWVGS